MPSQGLGQSYSFDLGLPQKINLSNLPRDLQDFITSLLNAINVIAAQLGGRTSVIFNEAVSPGDVIRLFNTAGTLTADKAKANTKLGYGIVVGNESYAIGDTGEVQLSNICLYPAGGLTPGDIYYLSAATAGLITNVAPAAGSRQKLGFAVGDSLFMLRPELGFS